jgi:hypothetical protein
MNEDQAEEIRAVLDSSAMLSYARGHVHVGEILIDIAAEGAFVGLPTVALLDAYARVQGDEPARARLGMLAALPAVAVLELGVREAAEVGLIVAFAAGDLARAHATWMAVKHDAYYLTTEPVQAPSILTPAQVHPIPEHDA